MQTGLCHGVYFEERSLRKRKGCISKYSYKVLNRITGSLTSESEPSKGSQIYGNRR